MNLIIFGAQGYALGAYRAISTLYPERSVLCFMVSKMGNNAPVLGGIPVKEIDEVSGSMREEDKSNTEILIATPENIQIEIEKALEGYGFYNHIALTSERWDELMKSYHAKQGQFALLSDMPEGSIEPSVRIYMAKSHVDRPLQHMVSLPDYVYPIQVGRENTEIRIADIVDNTGDNISNRNCNYSELTGLYWIWKNKVCDCGENSYYGFGQYRRMLTFTQDDLLRLVDNDIDAVLPYPLLYEPSIHAHHERYIKSDDWDALLKAVEELEPEYKKCFDEILNQQYFYNYNVILAKKSVLCDYCSWLFPILMRTEELTDGKNRSERYIGYMAETLETLYFIKNSKKSKFGGRLNIAHTLCKLYV